MSASFNLGTRTPLPSEEERYLDMLLMVREAMRLAALVGYRNAW